MYSTFDSIRKVKIFYSMLKMQDVHGQGSWSRTEAKLLFRVNLLSMIVR